MAIVIAGERSGSGKTTITLALLAALRHWGESVQSFKVGPDYIDPMFHQYVTQRPCYNLDAVLTSESYLPTCFHRHTQDVELAIVEGVMGLFDGAADPAGYGSTAMVAKWLALPVVLVVDCRSLSQSIAAIVHGYRSLDPDLQLAGVILNRVGSDRHLELLRSALQSIAVPILGVFRRQDAISLPDRHLGLVPTDELPELQPIVDRLATLGQACFDWAQLKPLLQIKPSRPIDPPPLELSIPAVKKNLQQPIRLGVARDQAFSFYYAENLELLEALGAELVFWSPLHDRTVPENIHGLYFGGGFPEMFAAALSDNQTMRSSICDLIHRGTPTYAECGGLMYLAAAICDFDGETYPMLGILPTVAQMGKRLTLGYRSAIAQVDTTVLTQGTIVRGHEFHRSSLSIEPTQSLFKMWRSTRSDLRSQPTEIAEGWYGKNFHASYLHLHWGSLPALPRKWLANMAAINRSFGY
jgi:cobyrinic acid a,c-diamide synthase